MLFDWLATVRVKCRIGGGIFQDTHTFFNAQQVSKHFLDPTEIEVSKQISDFGQLQKRSCRVCRLTPG
jgi:hypothetical protein